MKYVLLIAALAWSNSWNDIALQNRLRREARTLRLAGKYAEALQKYDYLIDSMGVQDVSLRVNRAHTLYSLGNKMRARSAYEALLSDTSGTTRAMVLNQWALSLPLPQQRPQALEALKEAMRLDPTNEKARYNYQWVLRQNEESKEDESQDDKEPEEDSSDQNQGEQGDTGSSNRDSSSSGESEASSSQEGEASSSQEGEASSSNAEDGSEREAGSSAQEERPSADQKESSASSDAEGDKEEAGGLGSSQESLDEKERLSATAQKLNALQLTPAQAERLLEAMRSGEVQYLQQRRRRASQPQADDKPDW